ncbi:class I SAM-dependent methyltransferase, partial [Cellulomonas hominis]|nr:class I SAM-dependent methyltransferase [Cellulomonas hominis]
VGVDVDPVLVEAARADHPDGTWLVGDLAELDLPAAGVAEPFDVAVMAGNVLTFLAPGTEAEVLRRIRAHLVPGGRLVVGFGAGRGYPFNTLALDAREAGLQVQHRFGTWDLRPFEPDSDFLVAVLA